MKKMRRQNIYFYHDLFEKVREEYNEDNRFIPLGSSIDIDVVKGIYGIHDALNGAGIKKDSPSK